MVYEYLHRQINDRHVREMIDFNTLFREAFRRIQGSGSPQDWGVDEDARLYFDLSSGDGLHEPQAPRFEKPQQN